jgi:protein O-mannosyl-transferase
MNFQPKWSTNLVMLAALFITTLIYVPGLSGGFALDDSLFLITNTAVHVSTSNLSDWVAAASSFPAGSHQGRWLGMLSFAANYYFTALDPFWLKLTNLGIHLLNGVLLFFALRALVDLSQLIQREKSIQSSSTSSLVAVSIAALWLVLPINLTGVLYVSQRLESLSNTFVFFGLTWYLRARIELWNGRIGATRLWIALVVCTGLGLLVKESAVLLPLYAFFAEFVLTGGRDKLGRSCRSILALYGGLIALPSIVGIIWIASWVNSSRSYARAFDIPQRLMTEGRVLIDYICWTLVPNLDSLTLFHDDIDVSRSLVDPPTTLAALVCIAALIGAALWQRVRRPMFSLGIFWFLGGHLLTATVIPLTLAFEHRNYFPSVGLLLAGASLVALGGAPIRSRTVALGASCLFAFYAFTTAMRAQEWSSPLQLAASDALKRPKSSGAQYEYAHVLLNSTLDGDARAMQLKAFKILEPMAADPNADALHNQLLIVSSSKQGLPIKPEWWESMIYKFRAHPLTSMDVAALNTLLACFDEHVCKTDVNHLRLVFDAAASHDGGYAQLHSAYARFATDYLSDPILAESEHRAAVRQAPTSPGARTYLIRFLITNGRLDEAQTELENLKKINILGSLNTRILEIERQIDAARQPQGRDLPLRTAVPDSPTRGILHD